MEHIKIICKIFGIFYMLKQQFNLNLDFIRLSYSPPLNL